MAFLLAVLIVLFAGIGFAAFCGIRLSAENGRESTDCEQMLFLKNLPDPEKE